MNILMLSNQDSDEKLEDLWLAKSFMLDGHNVFVVNNDYDESLDQNFDVFIRRSLWNSNPQLEDMDTNYSFIERIKKKNVFRVNFDGKFDGNGKSYLVDLFKKGYKVIPSVDKLENLDLLGEYDKYLLKLKDSYDGIGQKIVKKGELIDEFDDEYIIQPLMKFKSEVQFYYIKEKLEYALEFIPSKVPVYPDPVIYSYTKEEKSLADSFASLNGDYFGIQRIDFIKLSDGKLLLTEIEDIDPYLDLDCVSEEVKQGFIKDYKEMVYEYVGR